MTQWLVTFLYVFLKIMRKAFPLLTQLANWRKFSKCVTKAQLGHLRYGVSTLVLSLQLRCLCGLVYQCPDWAGVALKSTINWKRWSWSCLDESFVLQDSFATDEQNSLQSSPLIFQKVTGGSAIFTIDHGSGLKIRMSQHIKVSQFQNSAGLWDDFFTKKNFNSGVPWLHQALMNSMAWRLVPQIGYVLHLLFINTTKI